MKFIFILIFLICTASNVCAETYKWEDENGVHFTDNANSIPEQYRARVIEEARQRSGDYDRQVDANGGLEERSIGGEEYGTSNRMRKQHALTQPSRFDSTQINSSIDQLIASMAGYMTLFIFIGLAIFALWLFTLIDIIRSEFTDPSNKILWILLVIFLSPLSLLLYYLIGLEQKKGRAVFFKPCS